MIASAPEKIEACCAVLDSAVAKTGYLVGDAFTYADCNVIPMLAALQKFPEGQNILAKFPNLTKYLSEHATRDSFKTTEAPPPNA